MTTPSPETTPAEPKKKKTALDAPRGTVFRMDPDNLVILGLDTDHTPGSHPLFSEAEAGRLEMSLDEDFLLSVKEFGIVTAVTVFKMPVKLKGETVAQERAVVVAGRRRVRHAREINKILREKNHEEMVIQVPAAVFSGALEDAGLLTFIENEHRDDTPTLDKARAAARLVARGVPQERVCMLFRLSNRGLAQYLKLVQLHPDVLELFSDGKITMVAAEDIARKDYSDQVEYANTLIAAGGGTANRRALGGGGASGSDGEVTHTRGFSAAALRKFVAQIPTPPGQDPEVDLVRECVAWVLSKEIRPGSRLESVLGKRQKGKPGRKAGSGKTKTAATSGTDVVIGLGTDPDTGAEDTEAEAEDTEKTESGGATETETEGSADADQEEATEEGGRTTEPEAGTQTGSAESAPMVEHPPAPTAAPAGGQLSMEALLAQIQNSVGQAVQNV